jgi:hypothetical protein
VDDDIVTIRSNLRYGRGPDTPGDLDVLAGLDDRPSARRLDFGQLPRAYLGPVLEPDVTRRRSPDGDDSGWYGHRPRLVVHLALDGQDDDWLGARPRCAAR